MSSVKEQISACMERVIKKDPTQIEFHQAVQEVAESLIPMFERNPVYMDAKIFERFVEPERVIMFRVPWVDDKGVVHVNRGFRVEFNSAIGPYKGGLRFHPSVNLGILKFLGFEQIIKNSLTTLPMGGGKGGSDFDPKGKSDLEVMRFCHSFMSELFRHIGPETDVPAGDIGVGEREIGFMFGMYKKLTNKFNGTFTGKCMTWGGSNLRPEATGYGCVYFAQEMLATRGTSFEGKNVAISGSGNVAQYAADMVNKCGGKSVTMSDSSGWIYDPNGIEGERWEYLMDLKNNKRGRLKEYADNFKCEYHEKGNPWQAKCDVALPCATQNELDGKDAETLVKNGCFCVSEGANMPTTPDGVKVFLENKTLYGPGKAANAGGVAVSGLEMSQNGQRLCWSKEECDDRLRWIIKNIHQSCVDTAIEYGVPGNYVAGANISGFKKISHAMMDQGIV